MSSENVLNILSSTITDADVQCNWGVLKGQGGGKRERERHRDADTDSLI